MGHQIGRHVLDELLGGCRLVATVADVHLPQLPVRGFDGRGFSSLLPAVTVRWLLFQAYWDTYLQD